MQISAYHTYSLAVPFDTQLDVRGLQNERHHAKCICFLVYYGEYPKAIYVEICEYCQDSTTGPIYHHNVDGTRSQLQSYNRL